MNKTKIEWVKNPDGTQGYTWNPITGCLNGCEYCYARKLANGRLKSRYLANLHLAPFVKERINYVEALIMNDPFYPRFWEDRVGEPIWYPSTFKNRHPHSRGIFVCDMSDLFGIGIPEKWTEQVLDVIKACHYHRFYLLTKQPQNLIKWDFPDNCWVGVTATDYKMFSFALEFLKDIKAQVKYISVEPMLDRLNVPLLNEVLINCGINQLIIGAQTKPYKPPKIDHVQEIVEAADKAGIPVFLKKNLANIFTHQDRWAFSQDKAIPEMLRLRQEIPSREQGE